MFFQMVREGREYIACSRGGHWKTFSGTDGSVFTQLAALLPKFVTSILTARDEMTIYQPLIIDEVPESEDKTDHEAAHEKSSIDLQMSGYWT